MRPASQGEPSRTLGPVLGPWLGQLGCADKTSATHDVPTASGNCMPGSGPPCWCTILRILPHCRALYAGSTRKMVVCSVANCKNRSKASGRPDINSVENAKFFRLPKIITNQCKRTRELSEKRRNLWIARINRPEMNPSDHVRVCSAHFVTGSPSALFDDSSPDWAPSVRMGSPGDRNPCKSRSYSRLKGTREAAKKRPRPLPDKNAAGADNVDEPTKEDNSLEMRPTPETLRHLKENLQKHLLKLKRKQKRPVTI